MRRAGLIVWQAHQAAARLAQPGVTTAQIDQAVARVFLEHGAEPLFFHYPGKVPFPAVTCVSVNDEVVHGIPSERALRAGDLVSVDTGCRWNGWCADAAVTHPVGAISANAQRLLRVTRQALDLALQALAEETVWSGVARRMQHTVERAGFSVVQSLVGHGIGRQLHEPPQVPNYYDPSRAAEDFAIRPGLVLAIEPMINAGTADTRLLSDHWTIVTADGALSAHFEHTVAVTSAGIRCLTAGPEDHEMELVPEPYRDRGRWCYW